MPIRFLSSWILNLRIVFKTMKIDLKAKALSGLLNALYIIRTYFIKNISFKLKSVLSQYMFQIIINLLLFLRLVKLKKFNIFYKKLMFHAYIIYMRIM